MADIGLGGRLRVARTEADFTIKELARRVEVHPDSLSDYESGRTDPPSKVLRAIAVETNVSGEWLLFGDTRAKFGGRPRLSPLPSLGPESPRPAAVQAPLIGVARS